MISAPITPSRIIRSKRRTMALEVRPDGEVWLRIPSRLPLMEAQAFVARHQDWLDQRLRKLREQPPARALSQEEIDALCQRAREILPEKLEKACQMLGVRHQGMRITSARKRFGSCSSKGRICFSYLLMRYPEPAIDYVVLHEAAHLKHLNHSKAFYDLIKQHMPDYMSRRAMLRQPPEA